ncbi:MAG: SprT family zinc-dependent metalloprotease [Candidatus Levybacteria bacterium]|nr:SprT family zinc-dependent metalloprotease [Candidatus Levybacteria bacterium]
MPIMPKIIRSSRLSMSIRINLMGEVIVRAPKFIPTFLIKKFILSKQNWIDASLKKVNIYHKKEKQYIEGEEFMYLGNKYIFQFIDTDKIFITDNKLFFPKILLFRAEKEIKNWYIRLAKDKITERLDHKAKEMGMQYKSILFSDTQSKWGTCWPDNALQFNWRLIMAPLMVLDYVVIHELAHTKEKNHSNKFWSIVSIYTPAWKQHRKWLNNNSYLLNY